MSLSDQLRAAYDAQAIVIAHYRLASDEAAKWGAEVLRLELLAFAEEIAGVYEVGAFGREEGDQGPNSDSVVLADPEPLETRFTDPDGYAAWAEAQDRLMFAFQVWSDATLDLIFAEKNGWPVPVTVEQLSEMGPFA